MKILTDRLQNTIVKGDLAVQIGTNHSHTNGCGWANLNATNIWFGTRGTRWNFLLVKINVESDSRKLKLAPGDVRILELT